MGDAQIGLLIVTPLIIAVALRRMGALGSSGLLAVIAMSIAAAAVLFFSH